MSAVLAPALNYAAALARLPADALPAALATWWLARADAGAPMRDRADVLADTLTILVELNADAEAVSYTHLDVYKRQAHWHVS